MTEQSESESHRALPRYCGYLDCTIPSKIGVSSGLPGKQDTSEDDGPNNGTSVEQPTEV